MPPNGNGNGNPPNPADPRRQQSNSNDPRLQRPRSTDPRVQQSSTTPTAQVERSASNTPRSQVSGVAHASNQVRPSSPHVHTNSTNQTHPPPQAHATSNNQDRSPSHVNADLNDQFQFARGSQSRKRQASHSPDGNGGKPQQKLARPGTADVPTVSSNNTDRAANLRSRGGGSLAPTALMGSASPAGSRRGSVQSANTGGSAALQATTTGTGLTAEIPREQSQKSALGALSHASNVSNEEASGGASKSQASVANMTSNIGQLLKVLIEKTMNTTESRMRHRHYTEASAKANTDFEVSKKYPSFPALKDVNGRKKRVADDKLQAESTTLARAQSEQSQALQDVLLSFSTLVHASPTDLADQIDTAVASKLKPLSVRLDKVENTVNAVVSDVKNATGAVSSMQSHCDGISGSVDTLTKSISHLRGNDQAVALVDGVSARLDAMEKMLQNLQTHKQNNTADLFGGLLTRTDAMETTLGDRIDKLTKDLEDMQEIVSEHVEGELQRQAELVEGKLLDLQNDLKTTVSGHGDHTDASAASKQDIGAIQATLTQISDVAKKLDSRVIDLENDAGILPFGVVPPAPPQPVDSDDDRPRMDKLENEIETLKQAYHHLKQLHDNFTSEPVVNAMCQQFSDLYPAARDFQNTMTTTIQRMTQIERALNTLNTRMDGLSAANSKPQADLTAIKQRLETHDTAVDQGKSSIAAIQTTLKSLTGQLKEMQSSLNTALTDAAAAAARNTTG